MNQTRIPEDEQLTIMLLPPLKDPDARRGWTVVDREQLVYRKNHPGRAGRWKPFYVWTRERCEAERWPNPEEAEAELERIIAANLKSRKADT